MYSGLAGSKQDLATNLTSLSTLSYGSVSFVKMTAAGTFALDTTVLGSLATQSGTFSGTSSGTNTGDNAPNSSATFIGTTSVALNRSSGPLTLGGITLITPDLGTPSAVVLTNASGTANSLTAGLATNLTGGGGGTIPYQTAAGTTAMLANGNAGQFLQSNGTTLAPSWGAAEVPLTFSTGLTRATNTITNNLVTGLAGGQTVVGGTGVTDALQYKGTTGNGTSTATAHQWLVGNNGATTAGFIRNDASWYIGATAPTNLGLANINAGTTTIPALTLNWNPSGSVDGFQIYRNNTKLIWIDTNGVFNLSMPALSSTAAQFSSSFTSTMNWVFQNTNVAATGGAVVKISATGTAGLIIAAGTVQFLQGTDNSRGARPVWSMAGDQTFNINTTLTNFTQGTAEETQTNGALQHWSYGPNIGADNISSQYGNIRSVDGNGTLGPEVVTSPTDFSVAQWTITGGFAKVGTTLVYTHATGVGSITQTSANFATALKPNTTYQLQIIASTVSGDGAFSIGDPGASVNSPASVQQPDEAAQKFKMLAGTTKYYQFTTAASIGTTPKPLVLSFTSTSGAFTISKISIKEIQAGDFIAQGIFRSPGATTGLKLNSTGALKINGLGSDSAVSWLDLPASTTSVASLNIPSGVAKTTPIAGDIYTVSDNLFFTITTGAAAKGIILDNGTRLTAGKIPIATTNGRLIDAVGTLPQAGSVSTTGTSTTTFTVTIGTTMGNTTYQVSVTPTSSVTAAPFYVTNKTTTTFDVVYLSGLTGTVTFDWAVFP